MQTAHGGIQGDQAPAVVEATPQVIGPAEACGHGQDSGPVAPMGEGAKANLQASGWPEAYGEGTILSADSHDHRAANLQPWAQATLDADLPDPHVRPRDPRFATQDRHKRPTEATFTLVDFTYDNAQDCYPCPQGHGLTREARRHQSGLHLYRSDEASEADGTACPRRETCLQTAETRRKHLAVWGENAKETWSQQRIATIDPPEARQMYGLRLAIVEPVLGNIRAQTR